MMLNVSDIDALENRLQTLDGIHSIERAQNLEAAKKLCSASRSARVILFGHKTHLEQPKDWLTPTQYCDHEYGVLITEQQINRPRQGHHDDTLHHRIVDALAGTTLNDHSTPLRLKAAETIPATAPQSQFLLIFSSRTLIAPQ